MKSLIASVVLVAGAAMLVGSAAFGAEALVTSTVTAQVIALSITANSTVAYGPVATSEDTTSSGNGFTPTIQNDGSVNEDFQLQGHNSTPSGWTLGAAAGDATYSHKECHATCDTTPSWAALTTSFGADIFSGVAPAGTRDFDLQITVPTANAGTSQQNVNVDVQATAS